jgi:hypothetical protein
LIVHVAVHEAALACGKLTRGATGGQPTLGGHYVYAESAEQLQPKGVIIMTQKNKWYHWVMVVGVLFVLGAPGGSYSKNDVSFVSKMSPSVPSVLAAGSGANSKRQVHFVPNSFRFWDKTRNWPTSFGPAYADIVLEPSNFLPCRGGPFALCYYSGPNPETCTLTEDGRFANCKCFEIPFGTYFVLINGILN